MSYKIQHLKLGGILDQSIAVVRDNLGLLFGIMLYTWIPYQVLTSGFQLAVMPEVGSDLTDEEMARLTADQLKYLPVTGLLSMIGAVVVVPLANAAVTYAVAERYLGRTVSAGQAIRVGLGKIGPLIWTSILMGLAILGGLILLIIPGILFAIWFGLSQNVVVLENLSGSKALSRSKQLVRPYMGTFLMVGIIVAIASWLLGTGAALIPQIHLQTVVIILIQAVTTMFSTAAMVVFYFSCRCALENFDIEHLAVLVASQNPAGDADQRDIAPQF
ncbi:hypothetical protein SH661x_003205 [Planctomicrobium sp. SH661]|uniref:hypothetical protein n=1 Tax=Planctomicrobium sp. SH661 TaxID=3448124 RepID=UPI003F5AFC11